MGLCVCRGVAEAAAAAASLERERQSAFMQRVRALKIDRLRAVFNKLSSAPESHVVAVQSLLSLLGQASTDTDSSKQLLRYTLFQLSQTALCDCQEEFFVETDESHPTKLARVLCGLCAAFSSSSGRRLLEETIRGHFYAACPLTVPGAAGALTGDDFLRSMNFKQKKYLTDDGVRICHSEIDTFLSFHIIFSIANRKRLFVGRIKLNGSSACRRFGIHLVLFFKAFKACL